MNVYIIKAGEYRKVGVAQDVSKRMAELQIANPIELKVVFYAKFSCSGKAYRMESVMHKKFHHLRVRGEWFHQSDEEMIHALRELQDKACGRAPMTDSDSVDLQCERPRARSRRASALSKICNSDSETIIIDSENILCLLTSGVGLKKEVAKFLGIKTRPSKGWKSRCIGKALSRKGFIDHADKSIKQ